MERRTLGTTWDIESSTFLSSSRRVEYHFLTPGPRSECDTPYSHETPKKGEPSNIRRLAFSTGMVGHTGFEPVTSGSGDQRSIQAELMPPLNFGKRSGFLVAISSATFLALVSRDLVALSFSSAGQVILLLVKLSMARVQTAYSPVRPTRNSLEGLKTGAGRSGIFTTSPVLGFRPIRGARVTTLNVPNPRISMCSPCCNAATTESRKPSTTAAVSDFGNPVASAI